MRPRLAAVAATSFAAAALALAQLVAGPAEAAPTPNGPSASGSTETGPTTGVPAAGPTDGTGEGDTTQIDRIVTDSRIIESSGLVSSVRHAGIVWTHEDSGRPPRLYAINRSGQTVATLSLRGVQMVDWESMTLTQDAQRHPMLAVGDIGDNNAVRAEVRVLLTREPDRLKDAKVNVQRILRLRYPDGAADAETLVADPRNQRLYIVTKGLLGGEIYAVPTAAWPGGTDAAAESRTWPLTYVARVDMSTVTDGTFLPDGRLVLRNYGQLAVFADPSTARGALQPLGTMLLPQQQQGESVALAPGGTSLLIGSEGARQPLLRISLPPESSAATPTATAAVSAQRTAALQDGDGPPSFLLIVIGAGVVLLLLIFGAVLIALR